MPYQWRAPLWIALILSVTGIFPQSASAQFVQQGPKLVGTGVVGSPPIYQGGSVALSTDGNTAIVGGYNDNSRTGAAWVFTRSGGVWSQQGAKLVGTGASGNAGQGASVALSADGNTAIVGGNSDNSFAGAAWVFTRSGGVWTQQGPKLVGTGAVGTALQGTSVALSSDGDIAIVGGPDDNLYAGAAWIFSRSGGVWSQKAKLVGDGAIGAASQGGAVALSGDGRVALVGGIQDDTGLGAAWVFTLTGGGAIEQQFKLVGTGVVGDAAWQGYSVALSETGFTAIVGGVYDHSQTGAAWVFNRSGKTWTQQGSKLVGVGAAGQCDQGFSVAISDDGNTAIVGGSVDDSSKGAAWVFTRSGTVWSQYGSKLVGAGAMGPAKQGTSVALSGDSKTAMIGGFADNSGVGAAWVFALHGTHDFNGDHISDILWRHTNGTMSTWQMAANGTHTAFNFGVVDTAWQIAGTSSLVASTGDVDGDGKSDIFWRHTNGSLSLWEMTGGTTHTPVNLGVVAPAWQISGVGDFDGDGVADILWRHTNGSLSIWKMAANGTHTALNFGVVDSAWQVAGIGDVNHDGNADIVWRHTNGSLSIWTMNGGTSHTALNLGAVTTAWQIVGVADFDDDGYADLIWRHSNGSLMIWKMAANGSHTVLNLGTVATTWQIVSTGDYNKDGLADILWRNSNGAASIWTMNANGTHAVLNLGTVATDWTVVE